jgi:hypothetical protein
MRVSDLILRSIATRCVSKDEAIEVEIAPAPGPYSFDITSFSDIDAAVAASMIAATADRPTT